MATDTVSPEKQRSDNRVLAMMPVLLVLVILVLLLFGKKLLELTDKGTGKLILLGIFAALIFGSYLLSGLIIPKKTA